MPRADARRPRSNERIIRDVVVGFTQRVRRPDGSTAEATLSAFRGEKVLLDPVEEARLDSSGALAGPDQSVEDMMSELDEIRQLYVSERQSIASVA